VALSPQPSLRCRAHSHVGESRRIALRAARCAESSRLFSQQGRLFPFFPVDRACLKFRVFEQALRRFDSQEHPYELATPSRRASTAEGSAHSASRPTLGTERQWLPLSWDRSSLHEPAPTEEYGDTPSHHLRRASLGSARSPRHHDADSSAYSGEQASIYDHHPPHRRTPSTPPSPRSAYLHYRRNPSNESLPDHDIFDLPRRSTASNLGHYQSIDPTAPPPAQHIARPSHSALPPRF
jgi:hypothetical protein